MENPSFQKKKPDTKPFFAPDFVLALMVSERVLERQFQGLFESGPKGWTYNLKTKANYAQMYLKYIIFIYSQVQRPFETSSTSKTRKQNRRGPLR